MATLRVYSNRHIKHQVRDVQKGDWIYLENNLSRKRWSLYFRAAGVDESKLRLTYIDFEEFMGLGKVDFSVDIVGNPPYTEGKNGSLWVSFVEKALESNKAFTLIIPSAILTGTGNSNRLVKLRRKLLKNGLYKIKRLDPDIFPNASINTCAIYVDPEYSGDVEVVVNGKSTMFDFDGKDYFVVVEDKVGNSILAKMYASAIDNPITCKRGRFSLKDADVISAAGKNKILSGVINQCEPKFENTEKTVKDIDEHKVAFKYSPVHKNNDYKTMTFGYEQPFYLAPGEFPSEFYSYIVVKSKKEARELITWLKTDIVSWTLLQTRSQRSRDNTQFFAIPSKPVELTKAEMLYIENFLNER